MSWNSYFTTLKESISDLVFPKGTLPAMFFLFFATALVNLHGTNMKLAMYNQNNSTSDIEQLVYNLNLVQR